MKTLTGIFLSTAVVAIASYAIGGMDAIEALRTGIAGGFGALAMDVYRTLVDGVRRSDADGSSKANTDAALAEPRKKT